MCQGAGACGQLGDAGIESTSTMAVVIFALGVLLFAASLFTALFRRTQLPDVLLLIVVGILVGPILQLVDTSDFGKVGQVLSSVALVVILFQSGLALDLAVLMRSIRPTSVVTFVTFVVTLALVSTAGHVALGIGWGLALALGAFVAGTSSAVVIPLVQQLSMDTVPATILILESAITDVLCIIIAIAMIDAAASGGASPFHILGGIIASLTLATAIGMAAALFVLFFINVLRSLPNAVLTLLASVFLTYGLAELLGFSGAIASLALGFTLGNRDALGVARLPGFAHVADEKMPRYVGLFLDDVVFLLKTFFFLFLGISIRFASPRIGAWAAATVIAVYVARAVIVRFTAPRDTRPADASIMAVMVPKGLAAAVLAGLPSQRGLPEGDAMQQFTYMVVLVSIVLTSLLVPVVQRSPVKGWLHRLYDRSA